MGRSNLAWKFSRFDHARLTTRMRSVFSSCITSLCAFLSSLCVLQWQSYRLQVIRMSGLLIMLIHLSMTMSSHLKQQHKTCKHANWTLDYIVSAFLVCCCETSDMMLLYSCYDTSMMVLCMLPYTGCYDTCVQRERHGKQYPPTYIPSGRLVLERGGNVEPGWGSSGGIQGDPTLAAWSTSPSASLQSRMIENYSWSGRKLNTFLPFCYLLCC